MCTLRRLLVIPLAFVVALVAGAPPASAQQQHAVDPSAIAQTIDRHAAQHDADRAAIREALSRPEVKEIASSMGLDLRRANASVATLDGADLEQAAGMARQVNDSLVGGNSSVTLSTTMIIIILLVVILLIVAIK
jgi:hypothetical protein